jgi:hypothetical protein
MIKSTHSHSAQPPEQALSIAETAKPKGRCILVVSNENADHQELISYISVAAAKHGDSVHVIAPALNSRLNHWMSDVDSARHRAEDRLMRCVEALRRRGVDATGDVGDSDPIQAIVDVLAEVEPDELIIATHPEHRSNWLARGMVTRARERFEFAVTHFVVDTDRQASELAPAQVAQAA